MLIPLCPYIRLLSSPGLIIDQEQMGGLVNAETRLTGADGPKLPRSQLSLGLMCQAGIVLCPHPPPQWHHDPGISQSRLGINETSRIIQSEASVQVT